MLALVLEAECVAMDPQPHFAGLHRMAVSLPPPNRDGQDKRFVGLHRVFVGDVDEFAAMHVSVDER